MIAHQICPVITFVFSNTCWKDTQLHAATSVLALKLRPGGKLLILICEEAIFLEGVLIEMVCEAKARY